MVTAMVMTTTICSALGGLSFGSRGFYNLECLFLLYSFFQIHADIKVDITNELDWKCFKMTENVEKMFMDFKST